MHIFDKYPPLTFLSHGRFHDFSANLSPCSGLIVRSATDDMHAMPAKSNDPTRLFGRWGSSDALLVETRGVEPLSESTSSRISPGAVILLKFPLLHAK